MRNNIFSHVLLGCLLASLFYSCSGNEGGLDEAGDKDSSLVESDVNPNGDSELALLMRFMYDESDSLKQMIIRGDELISRDLIQKFQEIHTATPTDPEVRDESFAGFSDHFISGMNDLWDLDTGRVEGFNLLVQRCVNCHQVYCPGPIEKIQKLIIH